MSDLDETESEEEYSLEDLGAAYAKAMADSGMLPDMPEPAEEVAESVSSETNDNEPSASAVTHEEEEGEGGVTPLAIVEAALFVGHPDNEPLTGALIARTMRGVSADEVEELVDELNAEYVATGSAFRIYRRENGGFEMGLADDMRPIRNAFYGKVRETRLTQAAIDVLALVVYQPGITAAKITDQRGKDSGAVISQMVRRELVELRREDLGESKPVACYYPTERLLNLLGLGNLEDLPMVDEVDIAPRG